MTFGQLTKKQKKKKEKGTGKKKNNFPSTCIFLPEP